ncbi:glycosyl hydrolase family 71-domain-containing protein [Aspergillus spectabilis]
MVWPSWIVVVLATQAMHIQLANAKAVFAHFMVTNSENYTSNDWESDMQLAKDANIDAFALNMAWKDGTNDRSVKMAFEAANSVISMIKEYGSNGAHFQHDGKPFVSTFEGPGSAEDWVDIKAQTGCFFIPDWSSVGAKPAVGLANGVAHGLFSWSAWPWGNQTMETYTDASYVQYLEGKSYMMAISPWFYTNLPGYNKNWIWKGDSLWFDRWQELLGLDPMPEFVQIISWNDYGESHHIGPLYDKAMAAFEIGKAPFNYARDYPHDGWREVLPFLIDLYKTGSASMSKDKVVYWYRPNPATSCINGGTTVNTASQLQIEFAPTDILEDLFVNGQYVEWDSEPDEDIGPGVWFGSVPASFGKPKVELIKSDVTSATGVGLAISTTCAEGTFANYNAWVGSITGTYQIYQATMM